MIKNRSISPVLGTHAICIAYVTVTCTPKYGPLMQFNDSSGNDVGLKYEYTFWLKDCSFAPFHTITSLSTNKNRSISPALGTHAICIAYVTVTCTPK
jgi:hypothetical protein